MLTRKTHKVIWGIILGIGGFMLLLFFITFILAGIGSRGHGDPTEDYGNFSVGQTNVLYDENESIFLEEDCSGRMLFVNVVDSRRKQDFPIYIIAQGGSFNPPTFEYLPGEYYYFDYDNSGTESERFLEFKKKNHWNEEAMVDEYDFKRLFVSTEYRRNKEIWEYGNEQLQYATLMSTEKIAFLFDEFHVSDNFEVMPSLCDTYYRTIYGIKVPPKIYGGAPRFYVICLQADWGDTVHYLEKAYCAEIRLDHYAEDMEAFKIANEWETRATVAGLKKIYGRNLLEKDPLSAQLN